MVSLGYERFRYFICQRRFNFIYTYISVWINTYDVFAYQFKIKYNWYGMNWLTIQTLIAHLKRLWGALKLIKTIQSSRDRSAMIKLTLTSLKSFRLINFRATDFWICCTDRNHIYQVHSRVRIRQQCDESMILPNLKRKSGFSLDFVFCALEL